MTRGEKGVSTSKFKVFVSGELVKEYPTYEQCVIWCYLKGYVNDAQGRHCLQQHVQIIKNNRHIRTTSRRK